MLEVNKKLDKITSKIDELSKQKQIYENEKRNLEYEIEKRKLQKLNQQIINVDSSKAGNTKGISSIYKNKNLLLLINVTLKDVSIF